MHLELCRIKYGLVRAPMLLASVLGIWTELFISIILH